MKPMQYVVLLLMGLGSVSITDTAQYREVMGTSDTSSGISLAIVFDSTGSMGNDLKQVKLGSRRILNNHLQKSYKKFIKDFVLVQVHDPDVGPAKKTTSPKTFTKYLDSVYTQGGGDCPEMTITGIEMALQAARPNSLIYVFTDSSAKDHELTPRVLDLIQKTQSQVVFVLTGFCNSTEEIGFQVYRQIATISSGQIYILGKGDVKEFMKIIEKAVESLKVHILQEDSSYPGSKTYSFPIDSHVNQFTIQVTNFSPNESIKVTIRDPEGRELTESNGLVRLMKNVNTVYFASKENPSPGIWTIQVSTKLSSHSVRITGTSEVDFLPGFSTIPELSNDRTSRQPIKGVKNYLMANVTGNYLPGVIDWLNIMTVNGSSVVQLPVNQTENQIYISRYPFDIPIDGHFYVKLSGKDSRGYEMQRYSRIAIIARDPQPVSVSCPAKLQVKRGHGVNVTCHVQSEIPYLVNWYKNDVKIIGAETDNIQFKRTSNVVFKIDRANELSQGIYAAEMVPILPKQLNLKGNLRDQVSVTVLPPPPKVFVPKNASVEPLKDAELECSVFSISSNVVLKWYKDVPRFELKNTKRFRIEQIKKSANAFSSKLTILSTYDSDDGRYICIAEHEGGKSEAAGFIKIHTLPNVFSEDREITFMENESITTTCKATGTPNPTFTWYLNGRELDTTDQRINIVSDNTKESQITINKLRPQDAGELICKAKNSAGEHEIQMKLMYISQPKILSLDMSKEIPIEGDQQNMRCIAQGVPPPRITWEFNGSPVTTDGSILINETIGTLDISRVEKNMKGQWICVASNIAGTVRKSVLLDIGFSPRIKDFVSNIEANYGENITIKCQVDAQPPPRVKWLKGIPGGDIIPIAIGHRYFINDENTLFIKGMSMEDQTFYTCEAQNQHGKTQESVQIRISGIVAPKIAFTQSKQVVVEATLKKVIVCLVVESKPPAIISWLKNGKEIDFSNRIMAKENTLIIKNVKLEDEGIYTCIAKNQVGTAKFDIELDIQSKPIISGDLKTDIETSEGKKLVLQCMAKGDPKPKIEWRKGGKPLTMEPGSSVVFSPDGTELTIYSVNEEHAGTFTCTAINDHAAVVKEFNIKVKSPPIISKEGISDYEISSKESVELNCIILSGNPTPVLEWFKNGVPIVQIPGRVEIGSQKNILKIYGNKGDESGSYECRATNAIDSDSKFYQLTILIPPKSNDTSLIKVYTKEGDRVILPCRIDGYPLPTKVWSWKSNIIDLQRNPFGITYTSSDKNDLVISQMRTELQGIYTCEGTNTAGSTKVNYDVIISEKPKIFQFNEHTVFFIGNPITLTCRATGNPSPKIKWFFKGKSIPSNALGYRMVGENHETLMIESAESSNGGKYSCMAENGFGTDQKESIVTVFVPSRSGDISKNMTVLPVVEGGNITFTCVMNSTPPAEIKWFKNEKDIYNALPKNRFHISADGSTLTLYEVKPQDDGRYKCLAVNIPGQWSLNFTLQVLISPVILPKHSSKSVININEETDLYISCWAEGNPIPMYSWYKDNSQLVSGGRIEITNGGKTLLIKKVRRSDDAIYQCRVKNEAGEDKRNFDVNVYIPPTISGTTMRETPHFLKGSIADLWCNVSGFPTPQIKWTYLETGNAPLLLSNNSQLHFLNIDKSHITRYTCIATNEAGSARKLFDPILTYPPKINPVDPDTKRWILKGGEMRLACNSDSAPQAVTEWFKDGELIKNHPRINMTNRGTQLNLVNAKESDIGIFKCLVSNKLGLDKQVWTVDIMIPPSISYSSLTGTQQIALGGSLMLFCISEGRPKPKIEWTKDGSRIDLRRVFISENGYHLKINSTILTDAGRYQCTAENTHGQADKSFDLQVTYGPVLDPGGERYYKIERTVGGTTVLECLVSGNPPPTISWLKDGIPINRLPSYRYRVIGNSKQLEIIAMQASDAGKYSCIAKNTFGQMEIFMDVSVGAPPSIDRNRILNEYIIKVGDELRLPCPATGSPIPKIIFSKDGNGLDGSDLSLSRDVLTTKRMSVSQERQMLTIYFAQRTDSGLYQCNASNPIGFDVMEYSVRVRTPPEFDTSNVQPEVHWFTNQTRSLECTLLGVSDPPAKISWERHGSSLTSGGNIRVSPDGTRITVENVKQYDAGEYKCHAQNEVSKATLIFQVLVYVKPRFYNNQLYTKIEAIQNKTIQLSCECTGHPMPTLSWYRQEREILPGQETYYNIAIIRGNNVLQIANIQESDSDIYACTASNGGGTIEKKFEVSVILPPRIMKRTLGPENHRSKENKQITLHCNVYNYNATKPLILWSKEGSPILIGDTDYYLTYNHDQSLTILNPKSDESGRYTCEARNKAGQDSHSFILTITSPPKFPPDFSSFGETLTVQLGTSINVQCPAEGAPPPTIVWFHKDIPISPYDMVNYVLSNNAKVLTIPSVTKDGGVFRCQATNEAGTIRKTYKLDVVMPTLVRLDKVEVRERSGTTFTVLCTAEGHPKPSIQWARGGKGIFRLGTKTDSRTGLLEISDAREDDSGRYTCTGTNKISSDSKSVDVVIISSPKIELPKKPIMVRLGDQVLLPCVVEGTRPIRVHWYTPSNNQISTTILGEYRFLPEQGLIIDRVRKDHAGIYRCVANNDAGYQEIRITLDVLIPPKISRPVETEINGILNSVLQLQCTIIEGMPTPTIVWEKNGITLSKLKNFYTTTESGLIIFNSLKIDDEGSLTCIAKNSAGEDRLSFQINVELAIKVTLPMTVTGDEGSSLTITCKVEGRPAPTVTWKKEGQSLAKVLGSRFRFNTDKEIYIYDLKPEDSGNYNCIGERSGADSSTASTYLSVFTLPKFIDKPNPKEILQEGRWKRFRCDATSHPKPEITWMFNNRPIDTKPSFNGRGSITMRSIGPENAGEYKCIAKNRAGSTEYRFVVDVIVKPRVTVYQSDQPTDILKRSVLICKIEGKVDSVIWLKNGLAIENSSRLYVSDSRLIIHHAESKDTGVYQCIASNSAGEAQGEVHFLVKSPPKLTLVPNNTTANLGDILVLHCAAEGYPQPVISWYKNKKKIEYDSVKSLINNGSLRIIGIQKEHEGIYFCLASSNGVEVYSNPAKISIQIRGGWSAWGPWSKCSLSCGKGFMTKKRLCNNPPPSNEGSSCIGEMEERRECFLRFCPIDGEWSPWQGWSLCSTSCGSGFRQRTRRCDNPPPSNLGKPCLGDAIEDILCEGNVQCPTHGGWSAWQQWSVCSVTCGLGGTQRRERMCNNPEPKNLGQFCPGKDLEIRSCAKGPCPIDGRWSLWSKWSYCSKSCGSGVKQKTRRCDRPSPKYGGSDCVGANIKKSKCNESPCPVHGKWSNWGSWSECSASCGSGLQERDRTCTEPKPSFGGQWCLGPFKDVQRCNENKCNMPNTTMWSPWSDWGDCSAPCITSTASLPVRVRTRKCLSKNTVCPDKSLETMICHWIPKCSTQLSNYKSFGEIRGTINGEDIGVVLLNASWHSNNLKKTYFNISLLEIKKKFLSCFKIFTGLLTPIIWFEAYEVGLAGNGKSISKGDFKMQTNMEFAEGHNMYFDNLFFKKDNQLKMLTKISGQCPSSVLNANVASISLDKYKEVIVQMNPSFGKLNSDSSRFFKINKEIEPYQWSTNITVAKGRTQPIMVQQLLVQDLTVTTDKSRGKIDFILSSLVAEDDDSKSCPSGFYLIKGQKYCEDVNECTEVKLNKCDQICENTVPRFKCNCRPGFMLSGDGRSCQDVDECSREISPCSDHGQECVNTPGSYICQAKCNPGLRRSANKIACEDINECVEKPNICGMQKCMNTYGSYYCLCRQGYQKIRNSCVDVDECTTGLANCNLHQKCRNMPGSFYCENVCDDGYELINDQCVDINECEISTSNCSADAVCTNLPGSFRCDCNPGFQFLSGTCVDEDECTMKSNVCKYGCKNTYGSYECTCPPNLKLSSDRKSCLNKEQNCQTGFTWDSVRGCIDIDECDSLSKDRYCQYNCINSYGSYRCLCPSGFTLHPINNKCIDVDECTLNSHICSDQMLCINTPGHYTCIEPKCPSGYRFDVRLKSCVSNCTDKSEKCLSQSSRIQYIVVQMAGSMARPVEVRVINTNKEKEKNCQYMEKDMSPNIPVTYTSLNGSIILKPSWVQYDESIFQKQPYFILFEVACWSSPEKHYKIFQKSFYIYITLSKYPF